MSYRVHLERRASREMRRIPGDMQQRILNAIEALGELLPRPRPWNRVASSRTSLGEAQSDFEDISGESTRQLDRSISTSVDFMER